MKDYIKSQKSPDSLSNLSIMCQLSDGLHFLHKQNPPIILGSVNPETIFMKFGAFENHHPVCRIEIPDHHASEKFLDSLKIGSFVDAMDFQNNWWTAMVVDLDVKNDKLKIHFDDWPTQWDELI